MFPDHPGDSTKSSAERKLFNLIKAQTSDRWTCLHSLGLTTHKSKPWAEADFVLIGPSGVFCLEVKGGRIGRERGEWLFTNRHGRTTRKAEGPFEQAAGESSALRNYLYDRKHSLRGVLVQYGVVLPDVVFEIEGPDIEPGIVYDSRDTSSRFETYLKRLAEHWRQRNRERYGREPVVLDESGQREVVRLLRGEFNLVPTLRSQIETAKEDLVRLTDGQLLVLHGLVESPRALISGGAGTGKTLLALEEARRLQASGVPCLLLCFNRHLADWLRDATEEDPLITARGLHSLMHELIREADPFRLPDAKAPGAYEYAYPDAALWAILERGAGRQYGALIIDEGQDVLTNPYLDVLDALLEGGLRKGRWRVFLDMNQNLFDAIDPQALGRLRSYNPVPFLLAVNCRNTTPIAVETSILSAAPMASVLATDGPVVGHHWYESDEDSMRQLDATVGHYLREGVRPEQIVVLSPRRRDSSFPLHLAGVRCRTRAEMGTSRDILYSTIAGFKGLEADVVLLTSLSELGGPEARAALYVGSSRARACLEIFLHASERSEYERRAAEFGAALWGQRADSGSDLAS